MDADSQAEFEVLLADVAGNKLASDQLRVRLIREQRDYYWNHSDSDGWTQRYNERFITLSEDSLSVPAGGTAKVSVPVELFVTVNVALPNRLPTLVRAVI